MAIPSMIKKSLKLSQKRSNLSLQLRPGLLVNLHKMNNARRGETISPEVFIYLFSHTSSVSRHAELILFSSNTADRRNPTQATRGSCCDTYVFATPRGRGRSGKGRRGCCLSALLTFLSVNPTIVLGWSLLASLARLDVTADATDVMRESRTG